MERYHFFASSSKHFGFNCKSLSELKSDESESDGALATVLRVLLRIHSLFFDPGRDDNLVDRDVRQGLQYFKASIKSMSIKVIEVPGVEADDVIGTLAVRSINAGFKATSMDSQALFSRSTLYHTYHKDPSAYFVLKYLQRRMLDID